MINPQSPLAPNRCTHLDANQRRCRMLVSAAHTALCSHHATAERQAAEAARFTAILTNSADTKSASEINAVLAQLFSAVSNKKVDVRQGALLAYIAQLMLQTLKLADPATAHLPQLAR